MIVDVKYGKQPKAGDYVIVSHNIYNKSSEISIGLLVGNKIRTGMADYRNGKRVWVNKVSGIYVIPESEVPDKVKKCIDNNINGLPPYSENSIWI